MDKATEGHIKELLCCIKEHFGHKRSKTLVYKTEVSGI